MQPSGNAGELPPMLTPRYLVKRFGECAFIKPSARLLIPFARTRRLSPLRSALRLVLMRVRKRYKLPRTVGRQRWLSPLPRWFYPGQLAMKARGQLGACWLYFARETISDASSLISVFS